jgi:hypothetical protein
MFEKTPGPTVVKLLLVAAGLSLFGWGIRSGSMRWRWYGIGAIGAAAALRFWRPPAPSETLDERR